MDLVTRKQYPIIRPYDIKLIGNTTKVEGGMNFFPVSEFSKIEGGGYTLTRTGERFILLEELKKCCLFGASGVFQAFSNVSVGFNVKLRLGRIVSINFDDILPDGFLGRELVVVAHPICAGISGDVLKGEFVFPHFQFIGPKQINVTASAFDDCPIGFRPSTVFEFYLAFCSKDRAVQLLHKSILEFSQNKPNFAIVYLYAAIESAASILSGSDDVKVSARLHQFAKKIDHSFPDAASSVKRIKKNIERIIVKRRGDFAHQGIDLTQDDLLPCYETALEFFWHYSELKKIKTYLDE